MYKHFFFGWSFRCYDNNNLFHRSDMGSNRHCNGAHRLVCIWPDPNHASVYLSTICAAIRGCPKITAIQKQNRPGKLYTLDVRICGRNALSFRVGRRSYTTYTTAQKWLVESTCIPRQGGIFRGHIFTHNTGHWKCTDSLEWKRAQNTTVITCITQTWIYHL